MKKNSKKIYVLIAVASFVTSLFSQSNNETPQIEVSGVYKTEIIPDRIFLSVELNERTDVKHVLTMQQQEDSLLSLMKKMKISKEKIQFKDAGNDYINNRKKSKTVIAHKVFSIELQNSKQLNLVVKKLDDWMVYNSFISKVEHSKIDSIKKVGQINAIKNAQEKAIYLLMPLNKTIGRVLYVSDIQDISMPMGYAMDARLLGKGNNNLGETNQEEGSSLPEFEKMKLEYSVNVKFEIKQ